MTSTRVLLLTSTVVLVLCIQAQAGAAARSFTIRTSDGVITRIGELRVSNSSLSDARRVFGRPSSVRRTTDNACTVRWDRLRLRAVFANFGLGGACGDRGALQAATVRGSRFRTTRGVRVGTRSATIPEKHRGAQFVDGAWWIARHVFPYGAEEEETPTIRALVADGRVKALSLWVGGAGD